MPTADYSIWVLLAIYSAFHMSSKLLNPFDEIDMRCVTEPRPRVVRETLILRLL